MHKEKGRHSQVLGTFLQAMFDANVQPVDRDAQVQSLLLFTPW